MLADPVESDDDPVPDEDVDGVVDFAVVPVEDAVVEVATLLVDAPTCVSAAATASAATAAAPATPKAIVSVRRRRSARSRSAAVMRRFDAGITPPPGDGPAADATGRE
ncbi:MAG TPA: hypothetical protein VND54_07830 [Candidatus Saccharimonadales bacterium]|nr:hypothetical protein [Candidatus Saccharimonadales bacterium]